MRKLILAVALLWPLSAQADTINFQIDAQQAQVIVHALDVMVKSEGLRSASAALQVYGRLQQSIADAQKAKPHK